MTIKIFTIICYGGSRLSDRIGHIVCMLTGCIAVTATKFKFSKVALESRSLIGRHSKLDSAILGFSLEEPTGNTLYIEIIIFAVYFPALNRFHKPDL